VKVFFVSWAARGGLVLLAVLCMLWADAGSAWAGKSAMVAVGFTGAPPPGFQNVLLNVQSVRINPHANAGPSTGGWQTIPTPPGIAGGNSQKAEIQIDLNPSQDVPQLFNAVKVRPDNYKLAQIILDPNQPGTLVPNCPQTPSGPEGCINYPISLTNGQVITAPISGVAPTNKTVTQLILQLQITINQAPTVAGAPYLATLTPSQSTNALGTVTGQIMSSGTSSGSTGKLIKLAVTAETIGTNTAIVNALIKSNTYTLVLPAAAGFGTLYDLAVAGGGDSYEAARLPPLYPTAVMNGPAFSVTGQTVGNITGSLTDACTPGKIIAGAALQLLIPPASNPNVDCTSLATAPLCVTVASSTTDNTGTFPLPGTLTTPSQFQNVPDLPKSGAYAMEITASGYDPLVVQVKPSTGTTKNSGGVCEPPGATTFTKCNLSLTTAFITGSIPITPPFPGQTAMVQVFAEPTGTNNIQGTLATPIIARNPNTQVNFTLNVPSTISSFDLFATTVGDQYQGVSDPYQGHSIAVFSPVAQPGQCETSSPVVFDQMIDCVGHGSVIGTAFQANLGASIALGKLDSTSGNLVQITTSPILNQTSSSPTSNYAFCTPGDTYELQPIQLPQPAAAVTPLVAPSPVPTGDPTSVTVPVAPLINGPSPSATPTPKIKCPTTCSNPDGSCPGTCNTTIQAVTIPLLPPSSMATPTATATP
jgi:hypothetical protein